MKYLGIVGLIFVALAAEANSTYLLTPEEFEAGLAIRDTEEDSDDAVLGTGTSSLGTATGSTTTIGIGGGGLSAMLTTVGQTAVAAAPIVAQIAVAAAATGFVLKYGQGLLAAGVTLACSWLGLPLDLSATVGLAAPSAVGKAGGWLKRRLLRA